MEVVKSIEKIVSFQRMLNVCCNQVGGDIQLTFFKMLFLKIKKKKKKKKIRT